MSPTNSGSFAERDLKVKTSYASSCVRGEETTGRGVGQGWGLLREGGGGKCDLMDATDGWKGHIILFCFLFKAIFLRHRTHQCTCNGFNSKYQKKPSTTTLLSNTRLQIFRLCIQKHSSHVRLSYAYLSCMYVQGGEDAQDALSL